jgi:predicted  nucleic acid-binding Zn-ribbon protein
MARIKSYVQDTNITDQDRILGTSYEGILNNKPIYKTVNYDITALASYFSQNFDFEGVNYNLAEIREYQINLANSLGDVNQDGSLANISINFANDLVNTVSQVPDLFTELALSNLSAVPQAFADFLFTIADINEEFANQVLDLSTSTAYAQLDTFNALSAFVNQIDTNVQGLQVDVTNVVAATDTNTGNITANATSIQALGVRTTTAEADVLALQNNFTSLETVVNTNTGDISTNATQLSSLGTVVNTATTDIATLKTDVTVLESSIDTLSGEVTANASDISLLTTNVNTIAADVTAVQTDVTTLTTTVNNNTGDIATQATQVSLLANRVDTAESDILNTQTDVTSLTTTVDGNTGNIATNASNISILQTNVSTAQTDITGIITDIQQIETSIDNITGDVTANATAISGLGTRVTTAEGDITNVQGNITTLQTNLNTQTGRIDTNVSNIATLGTRITTAEADISAAETSITNLTGSVNTNTGNISSNATAISSLTTRVTTAEADISAAETNITNLNSSVNTNTGNISNNASAISSLSTTVNAQGTSINNLSSEVTTLETNLNTQTGRIDTNVSNINTLSTTVTNNFNTLDAAITTVDNARISGDSALSSSITSLTATVNGNTSSITTNANAISTVDGKLSASYGITVDAGGRVAGLKLLADGTTGSEFIARANTFAVDMPNGTRVMTVNSGGLVINGSGTFSGAVTITSGPTLTAINTAQSTANTAIDDASTAQSTANTAQGTANTAQSTANTAQTTANTAQSTANTALNRTVDATGKIVFNPAPSGSGLFMNAVNLGYYDGGSWKTYMQNNGNFFLSGSGSNGLSWNGSTLTVNGSGTFTGQLTAGFVDINSNIINIGVASNYATFGEISYNWPSGVTAFSTVTGTNTNKTADIRAFYITGGAYNGGGISVRGIAGVNPGELRVGTDANGYGNYSIACGSNSISGSLSGILFSGGTYIFQSLPSLGGSPLYVTSGNVLTRASSSMRYKHQVEEYDKGLNTINQLRPVYFKYIQNHDILNAGFIAEEFEELGLKEFVRYDLQRRPDSIDYSQITALLVKGIQEQQQQIDALKAEIELLKAQ